MHFRFEHEFDIDPEEYWKIFFSEPYQVDLHQQLKMRERKVIEQKEEGNILKRIVRLTPEDNLPAVFRSVVKDMSYTEHGTYDKTRSAMEVVIEPALMKNKFDLRGTYSVRPKGPGKCTRIFEGDAKVSLMLIGGQLEKHILDQMRTAYDIATRVTRRWIAEHKAAAT